MSMHDVQNFVPHLLSISGTLSNKHNHRSENIRGSQKFIFRWLATIVFILLTNFIGKSNLCSLELSRLCVVASLPVKLFSEAVS